VSDLGTDRWDVVASSYGTSPAVSRLAPGLAELVGISPGESVLDVGTGTGLALVPAAEASRVGVVLGVDRSLAMLQQALARVTNAGLDNVALSRADAMALPVRAFRFDVVMAASVWQFLGYAQPALEEWRRVLRPGGRLALSVPGAGSGASLPGDLQNKYFSQLSPSAQEDFISRAATGRPQPDLAEAAAQAGFSDIKVVARSWQDMLAGPEEWWALQWTHGVRFFLQGLDPEALEALKSEADARLERTDDGLVAVTTKVLYCVARR
jgi:ubiquinone/menaquinone biosynthesis C-methylase UbiE